jgi:hypothetical protein
MPITSPASASAHAHLAALESVLRALRAAERRGMAGLDETDLLAHAGIEAHELDRMRREAMIVVDATGAWALGPAGRILDAQLRAAFCLALRAAAQSRPASSRQPLAVPSP